MKSLAKYEWRDDILYRTFALPEAPPAVDQIGFVIQQENKEWHAYGYMPDGSMQFLLASSRKNLAKARIREWGRDDEREAQKAYCQ